jgi:hypothetical protein
MSLLNKIHQIINFATDKGVTGYHTPGDIDNEIHAVSTDLWQKYWDEYAKTRKVSSFMSPFEVKDPSLSVNSEGEATMTKTIEHPILVVGTGAASEEKEVHIRERDQWQKEINDPVAPPSEDYPICLFGSKDNTVETPVFSLEVRPTSMTEVTVYGLRKPNKPVWTYSIDSSGRRVFDEGATNPNGENYQDIEWSELLFNDIRNRVLIVMGINLRELEVAQAAAGMRIDTE